MAQHDDRVDVVLGTQKDGDERIVSVPRVTAERWPEKYPLAETDTGNPTAAARRATGTADDEKPAARKSSRRSNKSSIAKTPGELPGAGTTTTGAAGAENTTSTGTDSAPAATEGTDA